MKHTFNGDGISADFVLEPGESVGYAVSGTFAGRIDIDEYRHNSWQVRESGLVNQGLSGTLDNGGLNLARYRFHAHDWHGGEATAALV